MQTNTVLHNMQTNTVFDKSGMKHADRLLLEKCAAVVASAARSIGSLVVVVVVVVVAVGWWWWLVGGAWGARRELSCISQQRFLIRKNKADATRPLQRYRAGVGKPCLRKDMAKKVYSNNAV
jgi:hypothetical protein